MKITETNAIKVCDAFLNRKPSDRRLWDLVWLKINKKILTQDNGRCYFIVVNGIIYKLGYSDQIGGIKATIETYKNSGNSGRPSDRTHGIHILVAEELLKGNEVSFYFNYNEDISVDLPVMDGTKKLITTSISGKSLEVENMKIHLSNEGVYPIWNYQEAGRPWPKYIQDSRLKLLNKSHATLEELWNNGLNISHPEKYEEYLKK